jgi:hypothetical protein
MGITWPAAFVLSSRRSITASLDQELSGGQLARCRTGVYHLGRAFAVSSMGTTTSGEKAGADMATQACT